MEQDNSIFNPALGETGCRFRSNIENHIKDYELQKGDDVEWLLEPLDAISHSPDIVLDAFRWGDWLGWLYKLYFHQRNASAVYVPFDPPYEKYNGEVSLFDLDDEGVPDPKPYNKTMLVKGLANYFTNMAVPEVWDDLTIPFTELGIWQAQLLYKAFTFMPKGWHGNYNSHWYVFTQDDMQGIINKYSSYKTVDHKTLASYYGRDDILPSVQIDGENALVSYCIWTKWGGLCRIVVSLERHNDSVIFGEQERQVLVSYDCGIRF